MLCKSITIFLWKHYKYHRHYWKVKFINIALPIFAGMVMVYIQHRKHMKSTNVCDYISAADYFFMVNFLQSITSLNLVLLPIVQEKSSGLKEFMSISCRYRRWNLITFFVLQVLINFSMFGVVLLLAWSVSLSGQLEMIQMTLLVFLYILSNIAFTFAISVMFNTGEKCLYFIVL